MYGVSSNSGLMNEKACSEALGLMEAAAALAFVITEMIDVESNPPDRDTPTGTSLRMRSRIASSNSARNCAGGSSMLASGKLSSDEKRESAHDPLDRSSKADPAGTCSMPS